MKSIENISSLANQVIRVRFDDGSIVSMDLKYLPAIQRWSIDVSHEIFSVYGLIMCSSFNLLRQWKNLLSFGIACLTTDTADPILIDDFETGRANIFILTEEEVDLAEDYVYGTKTQ